MTQQSRVDLPGDTVIVSAGIGSWYIVDPRLYDQVFIVLAGLLLGAPDPLPDLVINFLQNLRVRLEVLISRQGLEGSLQSK